MTTHTKTRKPWRSGFCNPASPPHMHPRCRMWTDKGTPCACSCHVAPATEPLVWEGDQG